MAKVAKTLIALRLNAEAIRAVRFWAAQDSASQAGIVEQAMMLYDEHRTGIGAQIVSPPSAPSFSAPAASDASTTDVPAQRGFSVQCRHCGEQSRGATKFATLCFDCKSAGHSNQPSDCPVCTSGTSI